MKNIEKNKWWCEYCKKMVAVECMGSDIVCLECRHIIGTFEEVRKE